ncbi:MAG: SPOR domain-containing protein [Magnetococcales bacterium]|nr:SPOR domain-containing protein [Magnetococcales bacterium]
MSLLEMLDRSSQLRKIGIELKNRVLRSKKSFLLVPVVAIVLVFSTINQLSAQSDNYFITANNSTAVDSYNRSQFHFEPIPQNQLINRNDLIWNMNQHQYRDVVRQKPVARPLPPVVQNKPLYQVANIANNTAIKADRIYVEPETFYIEPDSVYFEPETVTIEPETVTVEEKPIALMPETVAKKDIVLSTPKTVVQLEEEPLQELKVVRTVKVAEKKLKVFKKDLTALQSWRYAVQVAAIYGEDLADELVDYLASKGYSPVIWESEDKRGNKFQRIWIGLYQNSEKAEMAREYYTKHENKQAFVTTVAWDSIDQSNNL